MYNKNAHWTLFYSCTPILSFFMQSIIYETMHRSKAALCIFFAGSQRRFALAIEVMVYIYRHRWKYRSSPFRVNSGIVFFVHQFDFLFNNISLALLDLYRCIYLSTVKYHSIHQLHFFLAVNWRRWWVICLLATICQNRLKRVSSKVYSVVDRGVSIEKSCVSRFSFTFKLTLFVVVMNKLKMKKFRIIPS